MEENKITVEEISTTNENQNIEVQQTVQTIEVEEVKLFDVKTTETIVTSGELSENLNHALLNNRELPNQHPIIAIEGLKAKLDTIESLQTVYSDKPQQADYYKWYDENPVKEDGTRDNRSGLFVSASQHDNGDIRIKICDATNDVLGVTISEAGFIGGQPYNAVITDENVSVKNKYNDEIYKYGLVAHSGVVSVQCESDVAVGDYVVPDAFGKAKKVEYGKYGYLVTGVTNVYGVECSVISLSSSNITAKYLSDTLYGETDAAYTYQEGLVTRMKNAEKNISTLTTSLQEFKNPDGEQLATKEDLDKVYDKVDGIDKVVDEAAKNAQNAANQASLAAKDAADIRSEAVSRADTAITAIEQIGESVKTLTYDIARYSIGEYSQAYGLTYEQAKKSIEINEKIGCVHIPTVDHEEMYEGYESIHKDSSGAPSNIQKFTKRYYYTWDGEQWIPSDGGGVVFSFDEYFIGETTPYWVVESDTTAQDGKVYHKGEVWYWNDGKPALVTTVDQNGFARAVNYIYKSIQETSIGITNARGDYAGLENRLNEEGAKTSMIASLVVDKEEGVPKAIYKTKEELETNETEPDKEEYYCVGNNVPYDVYRWFDSANDGKGGFQKVINKYYDGVYFCKVNTANIIAGVNAEDKESFVGIDANKINFNGDDFTIDAKRIDFKNAENLNIDAKNIKFEAEDYKVIADNITLKANQLDFGGEDAEKIQISASNIDFKGATIDFTEADSITLDGDNIELKGYVTFENLENKDETVINGANIKTDFLSAISTNLGSIETGEIHSKGYSKSEGDVLTLWSNTVSKGLEYTLSDDGTYYIVTGIGTCTDADVVIPSTYNELPVRVLGNSAFKNCTSLKSITIPDSVVSMEILVFQGCTSLTSVHFGSSLSHISASGFINCTSLTSIKIPNSVKYLSNNAFWGCSALSSVSIPDSVTLIGERTFYKCTSLKNIAIPDSVTEIGEGAFEGCSSLESITIPFTGAKLSPDRSGPIYPFGYIFGTVEFDGTNMHQCSYIEEIYGDDRDNGDGTYDTSWKTSAYPAYIPNSLQSITVTRSVQRYAFHNVRFVDGCNITIGKECSHIWDYAFDGCLGVTNLIIEKSVGGQLFIFQHVFDNSPYFDRILFYGTEADWNDTVEIYSLGNDELQSIPRYYYAETEPTQAGNYFCFTTTANGFRISCDDDNMIDSAHFKVSKDGHVTAASGMVGNCTIKDGAITSANGGFKVDAAGNLSAMNADISGYITALGGEVGGWSINTNSLVSRDRCSVGMTPGINTSDFSLSTDTSSNHTTNGLCFWAGVQSSASNDISQALFRVYRDGYIASTMGKIGSCEFNKAIGFTYGTDIQEVVPGAHSPGTYIDVIKDNLGTLVYPKYKCTLKWGFRKTPYDSYRTHTITSYNTIDTEFINTPQSDDYDEGCAYFSIGYSNSASSPPDEWSSGWRDLNWSLHISNTFIWIRAQLYYVNRETAAEKNIGTLYFCLLDTTAFYAVFNINKKLLISDSVITNGSHSVGFTTDKGILSGTWYGNSEIITSSWRGVKSNIEPLNNQYSTLFDGLKPVRFTYNNGQSNRYHTGFVLDDLKSAMDAANIDASELAAYCVSDESTGEGGIRYGEFIALCVDQIQKLKKRVEELEKLNTTQNDCSSSNEED